MHALVLSRWYVVRVSFITILRCVSASALPFASHGDCKTSQHLEYEWASLNTCRMMF